jgi:hypothetical protein
MGLPIVVDHLLADVLRVAQRAAAAGLAVGVEVPQCRPFLIVL